MSVIITTTAALPDSPVESDPYEIEIKLTPHLDLVIAGGIVLLIIAIADVVRAGERKLERGPEFGVVPLGTPLIAGPGTLTTALVLVGTTGYLPVILSLVVNLFIAWIMFAQADRIIRFIGLSGSRAFAKVAALILAAFAVKMIRSGIFKFISG